MGSPALEMLDSDLRKSGLSLPKDEVALEQVLPLPHDPFGVRDQLLPVISAGLGDGGPHEPEVSASIVRQDIEVPASVIDRVLVVLLPFRHQLK